MTTNGDQPEPNNEAGRSRQKNDCWPCSVACRVWRWCRSFTCWVYSSARDPSNLPLYLTAAFTLLLVIFAYYAWDEATKGTDIARQQLIAGEAAFVYIDEIAFVPEESTGTLWWGVIPRWRNSGNTPPVNLKTHISFLVMNPLVPGFTKNDVLSNSGGPDVAVPLGAHSTATTSYFELWPDRFIPHGKNGAVTAIWGWAKYKDVFPRTDDHTTRFCWILQGWSGDPTKSDSRFAPIFSRCNEGNCIDRECENQK